MRGVAAIYTLSARRDQLRHHRIAVLHLCGDADHMRRIGVGGPTGIRSGAVTYNSATSSSVDPYASFTNSASRRTARFPPIDNSSATPGLTQLNSCVESQRAVRCALLLMSR